MDSYKIIEAYYNLTTQYKINNNIPSYAAPMIQGALQEPLLYASELLCDQEYLALATPHAA